MKKEKGGKNDEGMHFLRVRPVSIPASSLRHFPFLPSIRYFFPLSLSSCFSFYSCSSLSNFLRFNAMYFSGTTLHHILYLICYNNFLLLQNPSSISIITLFLTLVLSMSSVTLRNSTFIYEEQKSLISCSDFFQAEVSSSPEEWKCSYSYECSCFYITCC